MPWCTLCRSKDRDVTEFFAVESLKPNPEARGNLSLWERTFTGMAPATSTLHDRTRLALHTNGMLTRNALDMAMLVDEKVYITVQVIITKLTDLSRHTQDQAIT